MILCLLCFLDPLESIPMEHLCFLIGLYVSAYSQGSNEGKIHGKKIAKDEMVHWYTFEQKMETKMPSCNLTCLYVSTLENRKSADKSTT